MGWLKGREQRQGARKQEKELRGSVTPAPTEKPAKRPVRFSRWTQEQRDTMTAKARAKYLTRWAIMSGGSVDSPINYDQPQIKLEWELCDVDNLKLVYKGRNRDEFLGKLPPECRALYFEKDKDGKSYQETIEKPAFFIGFLKALGILRRGDKKEIEDILRQFDEVKPEDET